MLFTGPYIRTIHAQAISEMRIENSLIGYTDIYISSLKNAHPPWMFCLLRRLRNYILNGVVIRVQTQVTLWSYAEVNCFMMQGQSNAGKTYWTLLVMCFPDLIGQTIQSQDFAYQRCLAKEIIQIPELSLSKPEQVEESKKIFEGLPTTVNVKNEEPRVLERTPVVLTCNNQKRCLLS